MMPPLAFAFVQIDGSTKAQPQERHLIRSHCMQRKNKQPGSRRSKREAAREKRKGGRRDDGVVLSLMEEGDAVTNNGKRNVHVLRAPPSDWALFSFPEELDISCQQSMHQYFLQNPIRDPLCPFRHFGIPVNFDQDPSWCFHILSTDQLSFRAMLLLNSASNDFISRQPLSSTTSRHLKRTLYILNKQLSDKNAHNYDTVLYVVSVVASIAVLFGDYDAARIHAKGLSEIIRLRGGFETVSRIPMVKFSIDRLNFSSSLATKLWESIYTSSTWKEPTFPLEIIDIHHSQDMLSLYGLIDSKLATVFRNLQYATILFNKHYYDQTPLNGAFLQECLGFIHSSLIELENNLQDTLSECLRLAMTAFLATTFRLPHLDEQPYCKSLTKKLYLSYKQVNTLNTVLQGKLDIWLLFICLISTKNVEARYVLTSWKAATTTELSWDEVRTQLKQVLWIDSFHDDLGKRSFEGFMT